MRAESAHEFVERLDHEDRSEAAATFRFLCTQFGSDLGALYRPLPDGDYLSEIGHMATEKRLERILDQPYWVDAYSALAGIAVGVGGYKVPRPLRRPVKDMMARTRPVGVALRDFDSVTARRVVGDLWTDDLARGAHDAAERVLEAFEISAATSAAEMVYAPKEVEPRWLVMLTLVAQPMTSHQLQAQMARRDLGDTLNELRMETLITDDNAAIRDDYRTPFPHGVWALTPLGRARIAEMVRAQNRKRSPSTHRKSGG